MTLETLLVKTIVDGKPKEVKVGITHLTQDPSMIRPLIQKRLDYAHELSRKKPDSMIKLDESAYKALEEITKGNPGFALYIMKYAIPGAKELSKSKLPYVITGEHIRNLGITLGEYENNPLPLSAGVISVTRF